MKTRSMYKMPELEEQQDKRENKEENLDLIKKYYEMIPYSNLISKQVYEVSIPYCFWFLLHYCCSHLYTYYCVNLSFKGFLWSPLLISSPHCKAFRWIIHHGGDNLDSMWILLGTWLSFKILKIWKTPRD